MTITYYTLQITYGGTANPKTEELKDLEFTHDQGTTFNQWARMLREKLYTTGFQIQTNKGAWEFVSPFRVHNAILLQQPGKLNQ